MRLSKLNRWVLLFLFGSLWGVLEILGGLAFIKNSLPHASSVLSAGALLVLAIARSAWNKPGTSTLVGGLAALFRLVNASPYYCHLVGIIMVGLGFDLFASLLLKKIKPVSGPSFLAAVAAPLTANTLFGVFMAFIIRYQYWAVGGWPKVLNYVFVGGGLTALAALVLVPLGLALGLNAGSLSLRRPRLALVSSLSGLAVVWALARFLV